MAKTLRTCVLCGTKYEHCGHCGQTSEPWKNIFCEENCRDVWKVLNSYDGKLITKEDAAEKLSKLDLSKKPSYNERWTKLVDELTPKKKTTKKSTTSADDGEKKTTKPKTTRKSTSRVKKNEEN